MKTIKNIRERALREKEVKDGLYDGRAQTKVFKPKTEEDYLDEYLEEELEEYFEEDKEEQTITKSPWRA